MMKPALKYASLILTLLMFHQPGSAQDTSPYNVELEYDIPITLLGIGGVTYGYYKIGQKGKADTAEVIALDEDDIIGINRGAINPHHSKWDERSNFFFYPSFGYPFLLLFDSDIRRDAATVGLLYL